MRERKSIQEADGLVAAADKFDDMYLRMEALANHAHDVIKYAGEEQLVSSWWENMQAALQKMQGISDEIRQPKLPGMEEAAQEEISNEQSDANVQEENQMENIDDMIANLSKLAGLNVVEAKDKKPDFLDVDKDGNKEEDMNDALDDKEETKEGVELAGCGMPMTAAYSDDATSVGITKDLYPGQDNGPAEPQGDMYQLNVQTPTKTMTFVTDNPEEIIKVLQASGVKIQGMETTGFQPPAQQAKPEVNSVPSSPAPVETKEEYEDKEVKEGIAALRKLSGYQAVDESRFGNSVAGAKGEPRIVGDTIDYALAGTGNAKSGRGDKGLSTVGDNPLGKNDRDLNESAMQSEFESWLKTQESK